jgi:hypothetical protein
VGLNGKLKFSKKNFIKFSLYFFVGALVLLYVWRAMFWATYIPGPVHCGKEEAEFLNCVENRLNNARSCVSKWESVLKCQDRRDYSIQRDHDNSAPIEGSKCVMWRQTGDCSANGYRQPNNDLPCSAIINKQRSGYCECVGGVNTMRVACGHAPFTCETVCNSLDRNTN